MGGTINIRAEKTEKQKDVVKEKAVEKEQPAEKSLEEKNDDNTLALLAYVLTWFSGLIIFLIANDRAKDKKYVRFHAIQAVLLGLVGFVISPFTLFLGGLLIWLYCLYIGFTYAYKGQKYLVPYIGEYAEKYANE